MTSAAPDYSSLPDGDRDPFRVLLVEDNLVFQQIMADLLLSRFPSLQIDRAAEGKEVWRKIDSGKLPELIFMDIKLPGENGLVLTKKIKAKYPQVVVIILTSHDIPEYREAAHRNGANYFIVKGSSTGEEIINLVESILSQRSSFPPPQG